MTGSKSTSSCWSHLSSASFQSISQSLLQQFVQRDVMGDSIKSFMNFMRYLKLYEIKHHYSSLIPQVFHHRRSTQHSCLTFSLVSLSLTYLQKNFLTSQSFIRASSRQALCLLIFPSGCLSLLPPLIYSTHSFHFFLQNPLLIHAGLLPLPACQDGTFLNLETASLEKSTSFPDPFPHFPTYFRTPVSP